MKRFILSFVVMASVISVSAFSYERAREQALFLSDKMAYELNLTERQYELAYQINLDYFMSVSSQRDLYGMYWQYRDVDLRYVLYDWQYTLYRTLDYFYEPLRWIHSSWYFPVYSRYSRTHFFFGRPGIYGSYRGGWRTHGPRSFSPYASHRPGGGRGLRDRHYPSIGRPGGGSFEGSYGGHHSGRHRNDGYRPSDRNGHGYGRGNSQGSGRGQSQANVPSRSNSRPSGSNGSGRAGGRSYGR